MSERIGILFVVKPKTVSRRDIGRAEKCGITIIECSDPESSRFLEPPATLVNLEDQARAAISLIRVVLGPGSSASYSRGELAQLFTRIILEGKKPELVPSVTAKR